jgi:hypothetical protein
LEAALADKAEEDARIGDADAAFAALLQESPDKQLDFVVSLSEPTPLRVLLDTRALQLTTVYTWLHAQGSLFPKVGEWNLTALEAAKNGSPEEIAAELESQTLSYLEDRAEALKAQPSDQVSAEALEAQLGEIEVLAAALDHDGLAVYGYRCVCSPTQVEQVSTQLALPIRVVELAADVAEPIWPTVPARDAVIRAGMEGT